METSSQEVGVLPQVALMAELLSAVGEYLSPNQLDDIQRAYELANNAHAGQFRLSGEDYICHPVSVALILSGMKMDADCIMAALMHDVLEDTDVTYEELSEQFNEDVAELVDAVSKLTKIDFKTREEAQA